MNKRIFIKDWLLFKPYERQTITDTFYLTLSNDVKRTIKSFEHSYLIERYLEDEKMNQLACFLTSYFEDIISGTNIWNSFMRMNKRFYKKSLPFFNRKDGKKYLKDIDFLLRFWKKDNYHSKPSITLIGQEEK